MLPHRCSTHRPAVQRSSSVGVVPDARLDVHRKTRADAPAGFYDAEAAGLRWLADAEPAGGARVVAVFGVSDHHIDVERLRPAPPTAAAAAAFGRALAATHAAGAHAFGSPPRGWSGASWIGRQPQRNDPTDSWGVFFAEQRVRPFVQKAVDAGHLDNAGARVVEAVCDRLAGGTFDDDRPPARIHGDLWSGNVIWTTDGAVLIDPAAHGGDGLTDLAMLALFGCPRLDGITAAYERSTDLPHDWRRLIPLHQLHPLATHTASHGRSYAPGLVDAARQVS